MIVALTVQVCPAKKGSLGWRGKQDEKRFTVHVHHCTALVVPTFNCLVRSVQPKETTKNLEVLYQTLS